MNFKVKLESFKKWLQKNSVKLILFWPLMLFSACFIDSPNPSFGLLLISFLLFYFPFIIVFVHILLSIYFYFNKD